MKFLVALTMLASMSAFAGEREQTYKCWDTAQGRHGYPTYVFEVEYDGGLQLELEHPREIENFYKKDYCYVAHEDIVPTDAKNEEKFKVCKGEGQRINGLIPIEIEEQFFEGTVYCEKGLGRIFHHGGGHGGGEM